MKVVVVVVFNNFIYSFLAVLGLCCYARFFLIAVSRGYSLGVVPGFLIPLAPLAAEHRLLEHMGLQ